MSSLVSRGVLVGHGPEFLLMIGAAGTADQGKKTSFCQGRALAVPT